MRKDVFSNGEKSSAISTEGGCRTRLERFDVTQIPNLQQKWEILTKWKQTIDSGKLKHAGEVALHGDFFRDLFGTVLGYTRLSDGFEEWNLALEQKTLLDSSQSGWSLGLFLPRRRLTFAALSN